MVTVMTQEINFFINLVTAIIKAAKGHIVENTEPYQRTADKKKELFILELEEDINRLTNFKYTKTPASYNEA